MNGFISDMVCFYDPILKVRLVSLVLGERTPVSTRMSGPPGNIPERWTLCNAARQFKAAVTGLGNDTNKPSELIAKKIVERPNGTVADGEW